MKGQKWNVNFVNKSMVNVFKIIFCVGAIYFVHHFKLLLIDIQNPRTYCNDMHMLLKMMGF